MKKITITTLAVATLLLAGGCGKNDEASNFDPVATFKRGMELDPTAKQIVLDCVDRYHEWTTIDIPRSEETRIIACAYAQGTNRTNMDPALDFYLDGE